MRQLLERSVGWIGFVLVIAEYALVSFGVWQPHDILFLLTNIISCVFLAYVSLRKKAYQPLTVYVVWALITLVGFF